MCSKCDFSVAFRQKTFCGMKYGLRLHVVQHGMPASLAHHMQGIAVGIATKIPPHNLSEVVSAMKAFIDNPDISDASLHEHVLGPDFPTGGLLLSGPGVLSTCAAAHLAGDTCCTRQHDSSELNCPPGSRVCVRFSLRLCVSKVAVNVHKEAPVQLKSLAHDTCSLGCRYTTGKGSMVIRSKMEIEEGKGKAGRDVIAITELPYQVYKAAVITEIADLVDKGTLDGISDIQVHFCWGLSLLFVLQVTDLTRL